ncbi:hypothetical protein K0M31_002237, partial [Melipona bicolor]
TDVNVKVHRKRGAKTGKRWKGELKRKKGDKGTKSFRKEKIGVENRQDGKKGKENLE